MKNSALKIYQGELRNLKASVKRNPDFRNYNKGMIKARLGFIYFVVLVLSLIVLLTR